MRIGASAYHASRIETTNSVTARYEAPTEIVTRCNFFTVMPASSRGGLEMMKYGEAIFNTWTAVANARFFSGKIKEGDVMWVDGQSPVAEIEEKYGYGSSANAIVKSCLEVNQTISIVLISNQEQVTE